MFTIDNGLLSVSSSLVLRLSASVGFVVSGRLEALLEVSNVAYKVKSRIYKRAADTKYRMRLSSVLICYENYRSSLNIV